MESRDTPTKFVLDVVALLEALGDREYIPVFLEMLEYDGPDVEGAVAALVEHKQVNQDWIERLAAFNDEYAGAFDFELGELRSATAGVSAEQSSREAERKRYPAGSRYDDTVRARRNRGACRNWRA